MNLNKVEVKQSVLRDVGIKLDEQKEACEVSLQQHIGAKAALVAMAKDLSVLFTIADKECDEGIIPDLETLALVKKWIGRSVVATESKAKNVENLEIAMRGRLDQAGRSLELVEKMFTVEQNRLQAVLAQIEDGQVTQNEDGSLEAVEGSGRAAGVRPAASISAQRKAEEAATKANGKSGDVPVEVLAAPAKKSRGKAKGKKDAANS